VEARVSNAEEINSQKKTLNVDATKMAQVLEFTIIKLKR